MTKWWPFCLFLQREKSFISVSGRQDWWMVLASYIALLCLHRQQCSTPGVSVFHSQKISLLYRRDFVFVQSNNTWRKANVQMDMQCKTVQTQGQQVLWAVLNMGTNISLPVYLDSAAIKAVSVTLSCCTDRSREEINL